jgi:hypothetical protein
MTTSQTPRLDAELLLGISPARGLHSNYYSKDNFSRLRSLSSSGLRTNNYSTWLIRLFYLGGYMLRKYSNDGFHEH